MSTCSLNIIKWPVDVSSTVNILQSLSVVVIVVTLVEITQNSSSNGSARVGFYHLCPVDEMIQTIQEMLLGSLLTYLHKQQEAAKTCKQSCFYNVQRSHLF